MILISMEMILITFFRLNFLLCMSRRLAQVFVTTPGLVRASLHCWENWPEILT